MEILQVSFGNYTYPIMHDFLRASESLGIPTTDDLQDLVTGHGAEHWLKWISKSILMVSKITCLPC
jgi:alcohol oxidase